MLVTDILVMPVEIANKENIVDHPVIRIKGDVKLVIGLNHDLRCRCEIKGCLASEIGITTCGIPDKLTLVPIYRVGATLRIEGYFESIAIGQAPLHRIG